MSDSAILLSAHTYVCSVHISGQTAITSLRSIKWPISMTEMKCSLRGTDCTFKHYPG